MSFLTEITALVGTTATSTEVNAAMTAGCADVTRRVALTNPEDLWLFTEEDVVLPSPDGLTVGNGRVYDVSLGDRACIVVGPDIRHSAADSNSIHYATAEYPVYYLLNSKIFILPSPNAIGTLDSFDIALFEGVTVDSVDNERTKITTSGGTTAGVHGLLVGDFASITQSDLGGERYYIGAHKVLEKTDTTIIIDRDYSDDDSNEAGYVLQAAVGTARFVSTHAADSTLSAIENFPSSYYRYPVLYAAMSVLMTRMGDIESNMPTLSVGDVPVTPSLETPLESLPTYSPPSSLIIPPPPEGADVDYSGIGDPPDIDDIDVAVLPILAFDISDITFSEDVTISDAPLPPFAEDGSDGLLDYTTLVRGKAPIYTPPSFSAPTFPTIPSLDLPSPPVVPFIDSSLSDIDFVVAGTEGNQPTLTLPAMGDLDYSSVNDYIIVEEDAELAGSKLQEIQAKLGEFQASLSAEQLNFNREMEIYKAKITEEMETSKGLIGKENQEAQIKLGEFGAQVQIYQIDVNTRIGEWTKNNIELLYTKWVQEYEKGLAQYQAEMANSMNQFNQQVGEYQAEIAKVTADASNSLTADNNRFGRKLQAYQGDIERWKLQVNKELTDWQSTIIAPAMTKFAQIRAENLQEWQTQCGNELQSWANRIQQTQQSHAAGMGKWQAEFGKITTKFQSETGYDINRYQAEVQAVVGKYQADATKAMESHKAQLEKYQAESQSINIINTQNQQNFQADLAGYQARVQADLAKYNADIQKHGIEYKWFTDKYMLLKQEYNEGFLPKPQKEGA